jgi:selenocysteine lyase/cysteine desulfurase
MKKIRQQFPALKQGIYCNTATSGLLSNDLMLWRQAHDNEFLMGGSQMKMYSNTQHSETRKTVGAFFSCASDNVALVPSFTIGLNFLLEGLNKNEKVLLLNGDYPSLNWPFESRGFDIYYVPISDSSEAQLYNEIKSKNITVLALSLVQWLNGFMIDQEFFKKLKNDFPDLMIIADGTQFCGSRKFNFDDSGIDILGASAYKWLLAGYGNGFILVNEDVKPRFTMVSKGYGSGRNIPEHNERRTFCKHLEPGHLDSLNFGSLKFSLDFLSKIGMDRVEQQNALLSKNAKESFGQLGLLEDEITQRNQHSTIFNIAGDDQLYEKLAQKNVICAQRGGGIRLSFHFYNLIAEIEEILNIVKS